MAFSLFSDLFAYTVEATPGIFFFLLFVLTYQVLSFSVFMLLNPGRFNSLDRELSASGTSGFLLCNGSVIFF